MSEILINTVKVQEDVKPLQQVENINFLSKKRENLITALFTLLLIGSILGILCAIMLIFLWFQENYFEQTYVIDYIREKVGKILSKISLFEVLLCIVCLILASIIKFKKFN